MTRQNHAFGITKAIAKALLAACFLVLFFATASAASVLVSPRVPQINTSPNYLWAVVIDDTQDSKDVNVRIWNPNSENPFNCETSFNAQGHAHCRYSFSESDIPGTWTVDANTGSSKTFSVGKITFTETATARAGLDSTINYTTKVTVVNPAKEIYIRSQSPDLGTYYGNLPEVGDIDNDGVNEVVAGLGSLARVSVYNQASIDSGWDALASDPTDRGAYTYDNRPVLYDFNGDGKMEILASEDATGLKMFEKYGNTLPLVWSGTDIGAYTGTPVICNIFPDGNLAVVSQVTAGNIQVYKWNQENDNFDLNYTSIDLGAFATPTRTSCGDWDNDGDDDLVVFENGGTLRLFRVRDGQIFLDFSVATIGNYYSRGAIADFDMDGNNEIFAPDNDGQTRIYSWNAATSSLTTEATIADIGTWGTMSEPKVTDINQNGIPDVLAISSESAVWMFEYSPSAGGYITRAVDTPDFNGVPDGTVGLNDIDGDGFMELFTSSTNNGNLRVLKFDGLNFFRIWEKNSLYLDYVETSVGFYALGRNFSGGDIDNDGDTEVFLTMQDVGYLELDSRDINSYTASVDHDFFVESIDSNSPGNQREFYAYNGTGYCVKEPNLLLGQTNLVDDDGTAVSNPERLTDGIISTTTAPKTSINTVDYVTFDAGAFQWARLLLSETKKLGKLSMWRYYSDQRAFDDTNILITSNSDCVTGLAPIFDAAPGGPDANYSEMLKGHDFYFPAQGVRCIRIGSGGSNKANTNLYMELKGFEANDDCNWSVVARASLGAAAQTVATTKMVLSAAGNVWASPGAETELFTQGHYVWPINIQIVGATEYASDENVQIVVYAEDDDEAPVSGCTCDVNIYNPDSSLLVTSGRAGEIANTGIYRYSTIAPASEGIYIAKAQCSSGAFTAFDVHTFHVAMWANIIPDLNQYIWNYSGRTLTDYNQALLFRYLEDINAVVYDINGMSFVSAADVWSYASRSLTDYNMGALPAYVWAYATRTLTDYNMSTLPDYLWVYSTRSLSDYNMGALPAYVWSNPAREVTNADINAYAVWNFAQRSLTDYNMGALPAYVWVASDRALTDYNVSTLPSWLWSGSSSRTLSDYNQSLMFSYLEDINVVVYDINGGSFVSAADVWAYASRSLTDYNMSALPAWVWSGASVRTLTDYNLSLMFSYLEDINVVVYDINGGSFVSAADVWGYAARSLTDYNMGSLPAFVAADVWGYASRSLTDYNMSTLPDYLWVYSTRSLTDYNMGALPAYVWSNPAREVTNADINAYAVWNFAQRSLTDYNMGALPAYVWVASDRALTDYNVSTLPSWLWSGSSSRTLSDYNQSLMFSYLEDINVVVYDINGQSFVSAADVWAYASRSLTDYNMGSLPAFVAADVWAYASRSLTDYNMSALPAFVWAYNARTLSDYNMSTLPAYIWTNPSRELTTADINAYAIWNYAARALSDYNMSTLPAYIWVYPNRSLTDYNFTTLPDYIWSGASVRTLTDYNQSLMFSYLEDLNLAVYDINGQSWISAADVWAYAARSLTDYNFSLLPAWLWTGTSNRSLTDYNMGSLPAFVWANPTRSLTDYNMSKLPDYLWVYSTRSLTDYNMSTLPAYVWSNPAREVTNADINAYAVWNFAQRALTDYNMSTLPAYIWVYSNRTLTDYNQSLVFSYFADLNSGDSNVAAAVWAYASRSLTDYNMGFLPAFVWAYNARTLSDYNMSTLPAYVWSNPAREVTNADINAYAVWSFAQRSLSDYNMSGLPDYIWVYPNRELTDYNFSLLPDYIWSGASVRTLTDYNQAGLIDYLADINVLVVDINGQSFVSAADLWSYSTRSLTDYNMGSLPAFVWAYTTRSLTDYNMGSLPAFVWAYTTRSLTDYNMGSLPAFVWSNPTRELTTVDINAWAVWNFAQRSLSDYNMSGLPDYIWVYPNRELTDYNFSLLPDYIWSGASVRRLTDYNQSLMFSYLEDINVVVYDINGGSFVSAADVWAYASRSLTDYNMSTLPSWVWSAQVRELTTADINAWAVWNFVQRSLSDYNQSLVFGYLNDINVVVYDINGGSFVSAADVWAYASRSLTDYNMSTLPSWVWSGASVRSLTDYNQAGLIEYLVDINVLVVDINGGAYVSAAELWNYGTRELTTADINAYALWNYASRLLSDYNQSLMWSYLTDINATVIDINGQVFISVSDIWTYNARALTDYNQSAIVQYLVDINSGVGTVASVIGIDSFRASGKTVYQYLDDTNSIVGAMRAIVLDINAIVLRIDNNFVDYNLGTLVADIAQNYGAIIDVNTAVASLDVNSNNQVVLDRLDNNVLPDLDLVYNKVKDYPYSLTCNTTKSVVSGGGTPGLSTYDRQFITTQLDSASTGLVETIELMKLAQDEGFSALFNDTNQLVGLVENVQSAQGASNEFEASASYEYLLGGLVEMRVKVSNPFDFPLNKKFVMDLPAPLADGDIVGSGGASIVKIAGKWVVAKEFELGAKQSGDVYLTVKNAWKREFERVLAIPAMADSIVGSLDGTGYYSQAVILQNDINEKYAGISDAYKAAANADQLVAAYDSVLPLMGAVDGDYAELQRLASQSSGLNALGMAVLGGQVSSTWGIVLVVLMGVFVLLGAIYVIWKMNLMHKKEADVSTMVQTTILKELIRMNRGIEEQGIGEELVGERLKAESLKEVNEEMVRELKKNIMTSVTQDVLKSLAAEKLSGLEKEAVEKTSSETEKAKNLLGKLEEGMKVGVVGRLKLDLQRELERELREEMHEGIVSEEKNLKKELEEEIAQEFGLNADGKGPAAEGPVAEGKKRGRPKGRAGNGAVRQKGAVGKSKKAVWLSKGKGKD